MTNEFKTSRRTFMASAAAIGVMGGMAFARSKVDIAPQRFPEWEEGCLDVHHIATGRGNVAFLIFPDGTTMLIDAGDLGDEERPLDTVMPHLPDEKKSPGERIAEYVRRFSKPLKQSKPLLNYVFLTHFHSDHIGCKEKNTPTANGYALSGISMLAEHVEIEKLVDRGFPDYDFPSPEAVKRSNTKFFADYLKFVEYQRENRGTIIEKFVPGSKTQFALRNAPEKYPGFQVQNVYINGEIWTGEGTATRTLFPKSLNPDENLCSGVIDLSYGNFHYFSGGDIPGEGKRDAETPISEILGPVNVMIMNHHAYRDSINATFLAKLKPQVMVVPVWDMYHPHVQTLGRMTDKSIYPDARSIYSTGMFEGLEDQLEGGAAAFKPDGHVVVRVGKSGSNYELFVLDSRSGNYDVICSETFACEKR